MKFIRKNGRIIPIKDKVNEKTGDGKKTSSDYRKSSAVKSAIGAGLGAVAGYALSRKMGVKYKYNSYIHAGVGSLIGNLAGVPDLNRANKMEELNNKKIKKLSNFKKKKN